MELSCDASCEKKYFLKFQISENKTCTVASYIHHFNNYINCINQTIKNQPQINDSKEMQKRTFFT
ncbi:hypothetical protein KUTeg_017654 [Tegillarca granosa]|uniref:Uncharacterized protein n=1 Tax=Tegillarca granosa TaxID=220873 RepID=A0ABQ9EFJ8_TEGGR|nr:hypothetical protein KUTeg_017654 [Tegillarca granosa]